MTLTQQIAELRRLSLLDFINQVGVAKLLREIGDLCWVLSDEHAEHGHTKKANQWRADAATTHAAAATMEER
jgi:hypothetical protein